MRRWPIVLSLAVLAATLIATLIPIILDLAMPRTPRVVHIGTAAIGGPFALVDQHGVTITDKDLIGKPYVVTFGYGRDVEQTVPQLRVLVEALALVGAMADGVTPIFISIDSEHDTPATMAPFAAGISPRLMALTGRGDAVTQALKAFKVWSERRLDAESPTGVRLDFQPLYVVMDAKGQYVGHVDFTPSPRQVADDLRPLLRRVQ